MTIERLVRLAEPLHSDLDDLVHDLAQEIGLNELNGLEDEEAQAEHITAGEEVAATVNNGGLATQIEFLLEHNMEEEVERLIRNLK